MHSRVSRIINEKNGTMLEFKNDCIILDGVICQARYNAGLSFCPRANYPYWREIWLERANPDDLPVGHPCGMAPDSAAMPTAVGE